MSFSEITFDERQAGSFCFRLAPFKYEFGQDQKPNVYFAFFVFVVLLDLLNVYVDRLLDGLVQINCARGFIKLLGINGIGDDLTGVEGNAKCLFDAGKIRKVKAVFLFAAFRRQELRSVL